VLLTTIDLGAERCNEFLVVTIIPGNRNSNHPTEKLRLHQLLPLAIKGYELRLHRAIFTEGLVGLLLVGFCFSLMGS